MFERGGGSPYLLIRRQHYCFFFTFFVAGLVSNMNLVELVCSAAAMVCCFTEEMTRVLAIVSRFYVWGFGRHFASFPSWVGLIASTFRG